LWVGVRRYSGWSPPQSRDRPVYVGVGQFAAGAQTSPGLPYNVPIQTAPAPGQNAISDALVHSPDASQPTAWLPLAASALKTPPLRWPPRVRAPPADAYSRPPPAT